MRQKCIHVLIDLIYLIVEYNVIDNSSSSLKRKSCLAEVTRKTNCRVKNK